jgi:hypothetical protein
VNADLAHVLAALEYGPARVAAIVARSCGALTDASARVALYAGSRAGLVSHANGVWRRLDPDRTCQVCERPIPVERVHRPGRPSVYCSLECKAVSVSVTDVVGELRRARVPPIERVQGIDALPEDVRERATAYALRRLEGA